MLKRFAFKKIAIILLSLLFLLIIYLFPEEDNYNIKSTLTYINPSTIPIYLIDNNNLVSRIDVIKKSDNETELIDEIIANLTIDSNSIHIPNNFKKIIPKGTKIIEKEIEKDLLKINFSKELLNVSKEDEEKLIEALIYSLTEIKGINKIMIFVDGEKLDSLPNSKKILPNILDKSYGINKIYEIESMKNVSKVTAYFVNKENNLSYYTPFTIFSNSKKEKIEVIIEKLKSSPTYQTNLISYLTTYAELQNYEILEHSINLSFNNEVMNLEENEIIEEVKYSIALSVRDTYDIKETIFYIDNIPIDVYFFNN